MSFRVTDEQRRAWIAAANSWPPPSAEFLAELDRIPSIIHTRTNAEVMEVLIRELAKPRRFRIHRFEDGIRTKIPGKKKSYWEPGRTIHLVRMSEEQTNLI